MFDFSGPPPFVNFERPALVLPGDADFITPENAAIMAMVRKRKATDTDSTVTFVGKGQFDGTGSTSETVTIGVGTANAGDTLAVAVTPNGNHSGANSALSGVTIDGETMVDGLSVNNAFEYLELWYFDDTSGDVGGSVDLVFSAATAQSPVNVGVWRMTNVATGGPSDSATSTTETSSLDCDTSVGSIIVAAASLRTNSDAAGSWSDLTEDDEDHVSGNYSASWASERATSAETPRTITSPTWTGEDGPSVRYLNLAAVWDQA